MIVVRSEPYDGSVVQTLIREMAHDLAPLYGERDFPPQDTERWAEPSGAMLVAYLDESAAGCAGLVQHDATTGEIKRMFTRPRFRRRHVATALLGALEDSARRLGYHRLVLETGVRQQAARALYAQAGFRVVPCWQPFDKDPTSICYEREVAIPTGE